MSKMSDGSLFGTTDPNVGVLPFSLYIFLCGLIQLHYVY